MRRSDEGAGDCGRTLGAAWGVTLGTLGRKVVDGVFRTDQERVGSTRVAGDGAVVVEGAVDVGEPGAVRTICGARCGCEAGLSLVVGRLGRATGATTVDEPECAGSARPTLGVVVVVGARLELDGVLRTISGVFA